MPLYLSVHEYIKERMFDVWCPEFYHPYLPEEMKTIDTTPLPKINRFYMVPTRRRPPVRLVASDDPDRMQKASFPIEIMLDMFQKSIEFELFNDEDIVEILDNLDRYLMSLRTDVEMRNAHAIESATLVVRWRQECYKHYYRYMMTHPDALAGLYPNADPKKNFLSIASGMSGNQSVNRKLDPLLAKAKPPYEVGTVSAVPKSNTDTGMSSMETSLGMPVSLGLSDDGSDFNLNDFLKR